MMKLLKPSDILSGDTISYVEVFDVKAGLAIGSDENDAKYFISDHYCMNPSCKCNDVVLIFTEVVDDKMHNDVEFAIRLSLKTKKYEILDIYGISKKDVDGIVGEILNVESINLLKKRYQDMKEAGRAVLQGNTSNESKKVEVNNKSHKRNDPCICGSGKKYKKCCG